MWIETVRLAVQSIIENRLRAFLTTLGIIFGVMAVIAVVSIVQGVFFVYTSQLQGLGAGFLFVLTGNPKATEQVRANPQLTPADSVAIQDRVQGVFATTPFFFDRRTIVFRGKTLEQVVLMPTGVRYPEIQNHFIEEGRFFSAYDVKHRERVVLLGPDLVSELGLVNPVGERIRLYGVPFRVVGVMEEKDGINAFGQPFDRAAILPYSTAESLGARRGRGLLPIKLHDVDDVEREKEEIRKVLRYQHRLRPGEPDDFQIVTQSELLSTVGKITGLATWVVLAIVGVALLVGGIGIMNIMLVSVTERTREIGIRMAVGARPQDIRAQFLVEASILGLIGGVIGIGFGFAVSWLVTAMVPDFPPPYIPAWRLP